MATIEEGLKAYIETNVTAAGNGYPVSVPVDADFPAWCYTVISDREELLHSGGRSGFAVARVQCDFMAKEDADDSDYEKIKAIATTARNALDGYAGTMSTVTVYKCEVELNDDWAEIHKLPVQRFDVVLQYKR